jgi:hypothetical protein
LLPLLGCSDISGSKGVVALELLLPTPPAVEQHDTLTLIARALDADGGEVAAEIFWRSPDSILKVDSTGRVTTDSSSGSGRIQARTGSLFSDLVNLEIHPRSDTVRLTPPTTVTVAPADSASAPLVAAVQSLSPDTVGISNTRILYEVVDTAAARGTVRFEGGQLAVRVATGLTGAPLAPVTLRKVPGATPPASVMVRVSATRPSGLSVPGSGQTFTINFQ